jgi:FkbH-like protein
MKLIEAFNILRFLKGRNSDNAFRCFLAAGLNPLHLETFLAAELGLAFSDRKIEIPHGLYGDLLRNLVRLPEEHADCCIVLIEWSDLDPRLGVRSTARWSRSECEDILSGARARALQIETTVEKMCWHMPIVLCCPTLPLLPLSFVPRWQAGSFELGLKGIVQSLSSTVSHFHQVRVLSGQRLDLTSPLAERLDVESEVLTGFPYSLPHASSLASLLAYLIRKPVPKKGLITDLDDTLWRGILGEVGAEGVSWDLDRHSQMHAYYQRLLGALAAEGVLIGVASKNELRLVEEALQREDLALSPTTLFPLEVNWKPKSHSVDRILKTWNVGPESVVFIDDSPLEVAEVKASHPAVECLLFPTKDNAAIYDLGLTLRDLFGKTEILEEDSIRAESIRHSHAHNHLSDPIAFSPTGFLNQVEAEITFNFGKKPMDPRALELVNKTNQFNLNGRRFTEASWQNRLLDAASFLLVTSYRDKYGPLGKIAVVAGSRDGKRLIVNTWVMSCRAFSRGIEYRCLQELFANFDVDEIELDYLSTNRNGPVRDFVKQVTGVYPTASCIISRSSIGAQLESLRQSQEVTNG